MARRNNGGLAALSGVVGVLGYAGGLENAVYPAKLTDFWGLIETMTKRNVCRGAWMLVLAVLAGVWPGIAEDNDQAGRRQPTPDLSGVSSEERRMIESACLVERSVGGPAAYNRCLASQLSALKDVPKTSNLSRLTPAADATERTPSHLDSPPRSNPSRRL